MNLFGFLCLSRGLVSPCRRASRLCWWKSGVFNRERRLYCTSKNIIVCDHIESASPVAGRDGGVGQSHASHSG